jgi:predicted DNA-binding mobile mystery protein A
MTTRLQSKRARAALDPRLAELGHPDDFARPGAGWIRAIRNALGMPAAELGRRMGVSHAAVFELERNEQNGTVRIDSLVRAAEALDCTFVYAFLPRRSLEETVRLQAERIASRELRRVQHSMALEDQAEPVEPDVHEEVIQQLLSSKGLWSQRP